MRVAPVRFTTCLAALAVLCNSLACICSGIAHAAPAPAEQSVTPQHGHPGCHGHVRNKADAGESGHRPDAPGHGDRKCEHCLGAFGKASQESAKPNLAPALTDGVLFVPEALDTTSASLRSFPLYAAGDPPVPPDTSLLRLHCALNS